MYNVHYNVQYGIGCFFIYISMVLCVGFHHTIKMKRTMTNE